MKIIGILLFLIGAALLGLHYSGHEPVQVVTLLEKSGLANVNIIRISITAAGALMLLIGMMIGRKSRY